MFGLLVTNLALLLVLMSLLALPALRSGDPSYVDAIWGLGFVVVAWATLLQTDGDPVRVALIVGLCTAWGLRLGGYLPRPPRAVPAHGSPVPSSAKAGR